MVGNSRTADIEREVLSRSQSHRLVGSAFGETRPAEIKPLKIVLDFFGSWELRRWLLRAPFSQANAFNHQRPKIEDD
jgi:hypothetical protein